MLKICSCKHHSDFKFCTPLLIHKFNSIVSLTLDIKKVIPSVRMHSKVKNVNFNECNL